MISIVVMLILAGVSLNATVGDNGIISKAKNATYAQSRAVLEEYINQYYVEHYEELSNAENKAVALKNDSKSRDWFYQGAPLGYVVDSDGNSHYFINVSGLPNEIKSSIRGGNANGKSELTYQDYAKMEDIYGVTNDLKVYYCSNGKDSITGIGKDNLDTADSTKEIFAAGSDMAKLITGKDDKNLTLEDLKRVKTLTIDKNSEINDLKDLYALISLQELTLDGITMNSLEGIENASQLNYVCIKNSKINDYSDLCWLKDNLKYLYLIQTTDNEIQKLCDAMSKTNFSKLTYFGIYNSSSEVTNIKDLEKLTLSTKESIKYLYLYNNNISSIESLKDFKNILILKIYQNNITSLSGIENMKSLTELEAYNCNLGKNEIYDTSLKELGKDSTKDSLNAIKGLSALNTLDLSNNYDLIWIDYLGNLNNLIELKLNSDNKIAKESFVNIKELILKLDRKCSYPSIYSKLLNSSERQDLINEGLNNSSMEWIALYNNKEIKQLRLDGNKEISDTGVYSIQNVLKTCSGLEVLSLENVNISSIEFAKNLPNLKELNIVGTNVTDLSPLKSCLELKTLVFDKAETDLTSIQDIISNMNIGLTRVNGSFFRDEISGIVGLNEKALKSLENCSKITNLNIVARGRYSELGVSNLDLTNCTSLNTVRLDSTNMNLKLPNSLKNLLVSWRSSNNNFDLSNCTNVEKVSFYEGNQNALKFFSSHLGNVKINELSLTRYQSFEGLINISSNCTVENFYSSMNGILESSAVINYADNLANIPGLKTINISQHGDFKGFSSDTSFPNLKTLVILDSNSIESLEFLSNSLLLQSISISKGKISSFKGIEALKELKSIKISNNSISSVYEIQNLNNITSLNLEKNCIYDTTTYVNSSGEKVTINNLEILANLNKNGNLRTLYLAGNQGITDWSKLSNISNWTDKSGW